VQKFAPVVAVINHIIDITGGLTACYSQPLIDHKLDIAGLMSSVPGEEVAHTYGQLNKAASVMGSTLASPFMTLFSFMALLIPELKLGDQGLFDINRFR
jgi:adenine deaminase